MKNEKQQTPPVMGVEIEIKNNNQKQKLKHYFAKFIKQN